MINYSDINYAHNRLVGTIVFYAGEPVKVTNIDKEVIYVIHLISGNNVAYPLDDKKLDITPVPLGYANHNKEAFYLSRCPMRRDWKQGLRETTLRVQNIGSKVPVPEPISSSAIGKTIINDYPTFDKAAHYVQNKILYSVAWCRTFAVDRELQIWHQASRMVGIFTDITNRKFDLKDQYFWARETLQESLG